MEHFKKLSETNISKSVEKKNNLDYLPWADAWKATKGIYPDAVYEIKRFENNLPYVYDENTGYMCFTAVTIEGITHEMWLPVMDFKNKANMDATMTDINKTIMRCLTKNLAMFGMGLALYTGEDLPQPEPEINEKFAATVFDRCAACETMEALDAKWSEIEPHGAKENKPTKDLCYTHYLNRKKALEG